MKNRMADFFSKNRRIIILYLIMNIAYTFIGYAAFKLFTSDASFGRLSTTNIDVLNIFTRWDGMHYDSIAREGYGVYNENNIAFFPLYPLLMSILYRLTGILPVYWGLIISRLSCLIFMILLYELLKLDYNEEQSFRAVLYMAVFPASFFFISLYTEALFLLLVLSSVLYFRKGNYILAAVCSMFSTALRPVGIFMVPVLLAEYFLKDRWVIGNEGIKSEDSPNEPRKKDMDNLKNEKVPLLSFASIKPVLILGIIPLGLISFMIYCGIREGDILAFSHAEKAYLRFLTVPFVPLWNSVTYLAKWILEIAGVIIPYDESGIIQPTDWRLVLNFFKETLFGTFFCGMIAAMFKKIRPSYWLYSFLMFILPFSTAVGNEGLSGMPRYVLILFPVFCFMAGLGNNKKFHYSYIAVSLILGAVFMSLFSCWYWVA